MDASLCFRRSLVARWLSVLGLAVPAAAGGLAGCGGNVVVAPSGAGGGGGNGGSGGDSVNTGGNSGGGGGWSGASKQCIEPEGGTGGASSDPDPYQCLTADEAYPYLDIPPCGWVESGPTIENAQCCYIVAGDECGPAGRPYLVDGRAHTAEACRGGTATARGRDLAAWTEAGARRPEIEGLSAEHRAALAEAWARDGLLEHASVASFGRFALELLASGAPAALVADAHRAALDEVRHARLCFGLASAYAGETIAPGPFDFGRGVPVDPDLARVAARTFLEGCVGETLAAVQAVEQRAAAQDLSVREVLAIVAEDEMRHAELAWRTVAWALRAGGEPVRAALQEALTKVTAGIGDTPVDATLRAHGRLDAAALRASVERTLREVVWPCARGLLGGSSAPLRAAAPRGGEPRHDLAAA